MSIEGTHREFEHARAARRTGEPGLQRHAVGEKRASLRDMLVPLSPRCLAEHLLPTSLLRGRHSLSLSSIVGFSFSFPLFFDDDFFFLYSRWVWKVWLTSDKNYFWCTQRSVVISCIIF